ncbi:MAG: helix-turn-helix transcriptional regulator [Nitrospirales bacterium]
MKKKSKIKFEESSGNVFADMGLKDADSLLMRAELGHQILKILKSRGLKKQKDVQAVLEIGQAEVSQLMNARYHRFSEARLMSFLNKLDRKVTVQVSRRKKNEPLQEVVLV